MERIVRQFRQTCRGSGLVCAVQIRKDGFLFRDRFAQRFRVPAHCGQKIFVCHVDHRQRLNVQHFHIILQKDLTPRTDFDLRQNLMLRKQFDILLVGIMRQRIRRRDKIRQSADSRRFFDPRLVIAVSVENDAFMLLDRLTDQAVERDMEIISALEIIRELTRSCRQNRAYGTRTYCP